MKKGNTKLLTQINDGLAKIKKDGEFARSITSGLASSPEGSASRLSLIAPGTLTPNPRAGKCRKMSLSLLLLKQEQVTMNPIESILSRYPLMVLDCALGTEIAKRGFDTNDSLWSAKALYERPELIREIFEEYYDQGADLVATASYQATIPGFEAKGSRMMIRD